MTRIHCASGLSRRCMLLAGAAAATAIPLISGCASGHGEYTTEGIALAEKRLSQLKSGTEYQMAHQQYLASELDKALKSVNNSIALQDTVAKSHLLKGRILIEKGSLEAARQSLLTAQGIDQTAETSYYLGIIEERFSRSEHALDHYLEAATLDTENPQYVVAVAEMLISMDRIGEAKTYLQKADEQFEYNAGVRQALGQIAMLENDIEAAIELLTAARLLAPDDPVILEDLVRAQMGGHKFADAEFHLSQLTKLLDEPRRDLRHLQVNCLLAMDRPVEAREILVELTTDGDGSRDVRAWIALADVSFMLDDRPRLRRAAARVIAMAPDRYEGYFLKALYHRMVEEPEKALNILDDAIALAAADPAPLLLRALILHRQGRFDEARDAAGAILAMDPNNDSARNILAAIEPGAISGIETFPR